VGINGHLRTEIRRLQADQISLQKQVAGLTNRLEELLAAKPQNPSPQPPPSFAEQVASLELDGGLSRGPGERPTLVVLASTTKVRITLNLENSEYSSYGILLETAEGSSVLGKKGLAGRKNNRGSYVVVFDLSPALFSAGDFVIRLSGVSRIGKASEIDSFVFRVIRK